MDPPKWLTTNFTEIHTEKPEESKITVMEFSGAAIAVSPAITALPAERSEKFMNRLLRLLTKDTRLWWNLSDMKEVCLFSIRSV